MPIYIFNPPPPPEEGGGKNRWAKSYIWPRGIYIYIYMGGLSIYIYKC